MSDYEEVPIHSCDGMHWHDKDGNLILTRYPVRLIYFVQGMERSALGILTISKKSEEEFSMRFDEQPIEKPMHEVRLLPGERNG